VLIVVKFSFSRWLYYIDGRDISVLQGAVTMMIFVRAGVSIMVISLFANQSLVHAGQEEFELGQELYMEYCTGCHGEDKSGLTGYSGDLQLFTNRLEGMTESMPDFAGFFTAEEIEALHAYLLDTGE
jgi:mono/diheme cytochrome c family protein